MNEFIVLLDGLLLLILKLLGVLCGCYFLRILHRELKTPRPGVYVSPVTAAANSDSQPIVWKPTEPNERARFSLEKKLLLEADTTPVREPAELVVCGKCHQIVNSSPVSSDITDKDRQLVYLCEHCGARLALPF